MYTQFTAVARMCSQTRSIPLMLVSKMFIIMYLYIARKLTVDSHLGN